MSVSDFGEGWVSSPIERWAAILLKSGVLFWIGGLAAVAWDREWMPWILSFEPDLWLAKGYKAVPTLLMIFGILVLTAMAANILRRFDLFTIRLLEGYHLPRWLRKRWTASQNLWIEEQERRFQILADKKHKKQLTDPGEQKEFASLDWEMMYVPNRDKRMPTRLGNYLRGMELRPREKYGLNAFVCWPRLWLLLPDPVKREIAEARDHLDSTVRVWNWSALFMVWTIWAWWAAPVSLVGMWLAYRWIFQAAKTYGQLVESAFDLHRHLLYKSLRWPLPENPADEKQAGKKLTAYLFRGSDESEPVFVK